MIARSVARPRGPLTIAALAMLFSLPPTTVSAADESPPPAPDVSAEQAPAAPRPPAASPETGVPAAAQPVPDVEAPDAPAAVSPPVEAAAPSVPPAQVPATPAQVPAQESTPPARTARPPIDRSEMVTIGTSALLRANESASEMVTIFGNAVIDGRVRGESVTVLGNVTVNGYVGGELICVLGQITLGPDAEVRGEVVSVGSNVVMDPTAILHGQKIEIPIFGPFGFGSGGWFGEWVQDGLLRFRVMPHQHGWAWAVAGVLVLLHLLFYVLFRRPVDATVSVLERKPAISLMYATVAFLLMPVVMILLTITVIGPVLLFFGKLLASFIGTIAIYRYCGTQLGLKDRPVLALVAGNAVFLFLYMIPVVSIITWFLVGFLAFGAALAALVESMRRESRADKPNRPGPGAPTRGPLVAPAPGSPALGGTGAAAAAASSPFVASPPSGDAGGAPGAGFTAPIVPGVEPMNAGGADTAAAVAVDAGSPAALLGAGLPAVDLLERVAFWPRLGAAAIDFIIVMATVQFLGADFLFPYLWLGYHIAFWAWRATTIGGVVLNLRIVRLDGAPVTFAVAAVRSLASIFSIIPIGLGFLWASWDENTQSWHDKIAGTTIVRVPRGQPLI